MSYNPGNRFIGPELLAGAIKDQAEDKRRRKENDALVKGFMQMHQSSPELQRILPVQDWGDVAPNQIKGWLQGLEVQQQAQAQQAAQQQAQQQAMLQQQQMRDAAARQGAMGNVLQGLQDPNDPLAMYLMQAQAGGAQFSGDEITQSLQRLRPPRPFDATGDGSPDFWLDPNNNMKNAPGDNSPQQQQKLLQSLMGQQIGGSLMTNSMRLSDYINQNYAADGSLRQGARRDPIAEELLRQANAVSMQLNGRPVFEGRDADPAPVKEDDDRGWFGRQIDDFRRRGSRGAEAGGQAGSDPLVDEAQAYVARQEQAQQGNQPVLSIAQFESEFEAQYGRKPSPLEVERARNKYWR